MKTPTLLPLLRLCGAVAVSAAFAACSGAANSPPMAAMPVAAPVTVKAAAPVAVSTLMQQIQAEVGDAACDSAAQCKSMALGHKACGGPEAYLAYSTKTGNGDKIVRLGAAYEAERRAQTIKGGMMSTCSVVVDPGATCNAGRCVTSQPGLGGPAVR